MVFRNVAMAATRRATLGNLQNGVNYVSTASLSTAA